MYKNQLQELAQRSCFNLPSYSCIREGPDHAPRFKATVNFNGETFESPTFCSTLRQAEHAAAEVALHVLSRKGPSKTLAARVVDGTGVYKNLLQETAQRAGLSLPVYTTVRSGPSHFPVFTCTVELAGMSFTGELAKTKKQAQKSAAMAAWSALKKLSRTGSSPPSSSLTSSDSGGNSEMDYVTVARYLATLQLPRTKKLAREGQQFGQGSAAPWRTVIPYDGGGYNTSMYSLNFKHCEFSRLSQEVPMCSNWLQERTNLQQSHLLAIASAPALSPRPHIFPFIPYIFQDDHGQLFQAEEPKPVSFIPGIEPYFCFSNSPMPVQVRNVSHVTIKEIEENPPGEMEWLESDRSSDRWKTNLAPNVSRTSPIEASNSTVTLEGHCEHGLQNMLQHKGEEKSFNSVLTSPESVRLESAEVKQDDCSLTGFADGRFGTRERRTNDEAKYRLQNQNSSSSMHSNSRLQQVPSFKSSGSGRGLVPSASAPPVPFRSSGAVSTTSARQQICNRPVMRSPAPAPSMRSRPWVNGVQHIGGLRPPKLMAPAVHIRSVVPVYSAPPPPPPPPKAAPGPGQAESRGD